MTNSPPSRNQAMDGSLAGLFELFRSKMLQNTDDMLPAKIIAYDRATNRAQVQPLIVMVTTDNQQLQRAQIASVPVLQIGGGNFVFSVPLQTGDLGWIKANDRDISLFKKTYEQSPPNTQRKHKFSDAVFIPDSFMRDVVINEEDEGNLVIQTINGSVRIALWPDKVKITAPAIILDTPTTTCTGDLVVEGETTLTGDVTAEGNVIIEQDLNVVGTGEIGGIDFLTHRHTGVQTGGGNTGGAIS